MEATRCRLKRRRRGINIDQGTFASFILHPVCPRVVIEALTRASCRFLERLMSDVAEKKRRLMRVLKKPIPVVGDCTNTATQCSLDT